MSRSLSIPHFFIPIILSFFFSYNFIAIIHYAVQFDAGFYSFMIWARIGLPVKLTQVASYDLGNKQNMLNESIKIVSNMYE